MERGERQSKALSIMVGGWSWFRKNKVNSEASMRKISTPDQIGQ